MNQEQFIKDLLSKISEMRKNNRHGDIRVYFQDGNINKITNASPIRLFGFGFRLLRHLQALECVCPL